MEWGGVHFLSLCLCLLIEDPHDCLTWRCHLAFLSALRYSIQLYFHTTILIALIANRGGAESPKLKGNVHILWMEMKPASRVAGYFAKASFVILFSCCLNLVRCPEAHEVSEDGLDSSKWESNAHLDCKKRNWPHSSTCLIGEWWVAPQCVSLLFALIPKHLSIDITQEGYGSSFLVTNKSRTTPRNEEDWRRRYPITPITTLEPSFLAGGRCPLLVPLCMLLKASHDCLTWRCHLACLSARSTILNYTTVPSS